MLIDVKIDVFVLLTISLFSVAIGRSSVDVSESATAAVDGFIFDGPTLSATLLTGVRPTPLTPSTTPLPLDDTQFNSCVLSCPVTTEYNPVCGTDNVDYTNPGGLGCAHICGKEVILKHYGRCSTGRTGK